MRKADLLRAAIRDNCEWCRINPESLLVSVSKAQIVASGELSASYEYRYTLEVLLMDFPGEPDEIIIPILVWARKNQPELIFNPDTRNSGITMEAQLLNTDEMGQKITPVADILFSVKATEAVIVTLDPEGKPIPTHRDEPDYSSLYGISETAWDVVFKDMNSGEVVENE